MGITRVANVRRDIVRRWELAAIHIVHTGTLHDVVHNVVLCILTVSFTWPDHSQVLTWVKITYRPGHQPGRHTLQNRVD